MFSTGPRIVRPRPWSWNAISCSSSRMYSSICLFTDSISRRITPRSFSIASRSSFEFSNRSDSMSAAQSALLAVVLIQYTVVSRDVYALMCAPMSSTSTSSCSRVRRAVPLNARCSRKCAAPEFSGVSYRLPVSIHTPMATVGAGTVSVATRRPVSSVDTSERGCHASLASAVLKRQRRAASADAALHAPRAPLPSLGNMLRAGGAAARRRPRGRCGRGRRSEARRRSVELRRGGSREGRA